MSPSNARIMAATHCNAPALVLRALAIVCLAGATVARYASLPGKQQLSLPDLPAGHVTCYRDDPKFNECFRASLQTLLQAFHATGVPEVGLLPLDPLAVPAMPISYTQGDDVVSNVMVTDFTGRGARALKVNSVRSNFSTGEDFWMRVNVYLPRFQNDGDYVVDGRFMQLPIRGKGLYNLTMGGMKGTMKLRGRHFSKHGVDHVRLEHIDFRPSLRSMTFHADDLFTGNKQLSQAAVAAVNIFWPIFYEATLPGFSQAWGAVLTERANQIFLNVPFDTLFPLSPSAKRRN